MLLFLSAAMLRSVVIWRIFNQSEMIVKSKTDPLELTEVDV